MDRRYIKKMERYWAREIEKTRSQISARDFSSWFDFWHTHPDWKGKGNKNSETKIWITNITYELLKFTEELTESESNRLQVWATICENTGTNAIYVHSKNPNETPFPFDFFNTVWDVKLSPEDGIKIDYTKHQVGMMKYEDEVVYYIRKKS